MIDCMLVCRDGFSLLEQAFGRQYMRSVMQDARFGHVELKNRPRLPVTRLMDCTMHNGCFEQQA
jgi:hypothetical protein